MDSMAHLFLLVRPFRNRNKIVSLFWFVMQFLWRWRTFLEMSARTRKCLLGRKFARFVLLWAVFWLPYCSCDSAKFCRFKIEAVFILFFIFLKEVLQIQSFEVARAIARPFLVHLVLLVMSCLYFYHNVYRHLCLGYFTHTRSPTRKCCKVSSGQLLRSYIPTSNDSSLAGTYKFWNIS